MSIEFWTGGGRRRTGNSDRMMQMICNELKEGKSVTVAGLTEESAKVYQDTLLRRFGAPTNMEAVYSRSRMKVIFDPNDFSAEPAIIGIDYGTDRLYGYKFTKK